MFAVGKSQIQVPSGRHRAWASGWFTNTANWCLLTLSSKISSSATQGPGNILNLKRAEQEMMDLCARYGFEMDLKAKVWQLSEGEKQAVEILKALYRGAGSLSWTSRTPRLTPQETKKLLESIEAMARDELAIVPFITHKLPIVLAISDRVTVLRRGKVVDRMETAGTNEKSLAKKMVGREVIFRIEKTAVEMGKPILQVENLSALNDKGFLALKGISFSIHEGEIFGIAGISGNGQQELVEALAGLRKVKAGKVSFNGKDITHAACLERWQMGIGYIPSDRIQVGSIGDFSLVENTAMNYYFDTDYSQRRHRGLQTLAEAHRRYDRRIRGGCAGSGDEGKKSIWRQPPKTHFGTRALAQPAACHCRPAFPGARCWGDGVRPE